VLKFVKVIFKWVVVISVFVTLVLLCVLNRPLYKKQNYTESELIEVKNFLENEFDPYLLPLSNEEYKIKIDKCLNVVDYKYFESNLSWFKCDGYCSILSRVIIIDYDIKYTKYCRVLTHELMHYMNFSTNERYIDYMTFKVLYESNDKHLHNVGVKCGHDMLSGENADLIIYYMKGVML
jgi:hypothetical protein